MVVLFSTEHTGQWFFHVSLVKYHMNPNGGTQNYKNCVKIVGISSCVNVIFHSLF